LCKRPTADKLDELASQPFLTPARRVHHAPARGWFPMKIGGGIARLVPGGDGDKRPGLDRRVALAPDCAEALGRVKTALRCAPALRGLDPPQRASASWRLSERRWMDRETRSPWLFLPRVFRVRSWLRQETMSVGATYVIFDGDKDRYAFAFMRGWKVNDRV